jgi:hypothetical protein
MKNTIEREIKESSGRGVKFKRGFGRELQSDGLMDGETVWLDYLCELMKLDRDVHLYLNEIHGASILREGSRIGQNHMKALRRFLVNFGKEHNTISPGQEEESVFLNEDLQDLYYELIRKGTSSLKEALDVGVQIQQSGIESLNRAAGSTARTDLKHLYNSLLQDLVNYLDALNADIGRRWNSGKFHSGEGKV